MDEPKIKSLHVFTLLLVFWCAWLYTEVADYISRSEHAAKVDAFMTRGDRFTADDGRALRKLVEGHVNENQRQIEQLNKKIDQLESR